MKKYKIVSLPGDGIGPEIMESALDILDFVAKKNKVSFEIQHKDIGGISIDLHGEPITSDTLECCLDSDIILLGAVGGNKWDTLPSNKRPERGLLQLRKALQLYSNIRPAEIFTSLEESSSLKKEVIKGVNIIVVRELTGGIYFGNPRGIDKEKGYNTLIYNRGEIERISRVAFELAKNRNNHVISVDKANVLESSQFWRSVVHDVHRDYPNVKLEDMYIDNAAMQLVSRPKQFDVILTQNLFGDILSDITGMITGSLGMLPSASLGSKYSLYEPVHGTAPDIAGKNKANPIGMVSSVEMMFRYTMKNSFAANQIKNAIENLLKGGYRTFDIAKNDSKVLTTSQFTKKLIEFLD